MEHIIKMSDKIEHLTGQGLEYLCDKDGTPIAMFIDGNMPSTPSIDPNEATKKAA